MKSAYELAMERFQDPEEKTRAPLTEEQKAELAEIDRKYDARIAEKEVFLEPKIAEARQSGDPTTIEQLETQLRNEKARFEEDRERAKDKIRSGGSA